MEDAVERTDIAGDATRGGNHSRSVDEEERGSWGGGAQVWSPSLVMGMGSRHVEHFTVGRDILSGCFDIEIIGRCRCRCRCRCD